MHTLKDAPLKTWILRACVLLVVVPTVQATPETVLLHNRYRRVAIRLRPRALLKEPTVTATNPIPKPLLRGRSSRSQQNNRWLVGPGDVREPLTKCALATLMPKQF